MNRHNMTPATRPMASGNTGFSRLCKSLPEIPNFTNKGPHKDTEVYVSNVSICTRRRTFILCVILINMFDQKLSMVSWTISSLTHLLINTALHMFTDRSLLTTLFKFKIWTRTRPRRSIFDIGSTIVHNCVRESRRELEICDFVYTPEFTDVNKRASCGYLKLATGCGRAFVSGWVV